MASLLNMLKTVFDVRAPDQRDNLALAQFQGVCDAFADLQSRVAVAGIANGAGSPALPERAQMFYALAAARMQLAEQLQRALREEMQLPARPRQSQARMDLEDLTGQINVLSLAASLELAQPNSTAGEWELQHHLREAIDPPPTSERGEDTIAHARAMFNGGLVLLTLLSQQLKERTQALGADKLSTANMLLAAAQHEFDTMRPVASQLETNPQLFGAPGSPLHEELEDQIERMVRLLESAAAELAVPGVTQTAVWKNIFGDPRSLTMSAQPRARTQSLAADRPWQRDIWCMTSDLFKNTNRNDRRAQRVLQAMWAGDPDPSKTWALYDSVQRLEDEGAIQPLGSYFNACPWTDIWRVRRTVRVGNKVVPQGSTFTLHVESEPDGEFRRDVIVADFAPADELDYCDTEDARRGGH